MLAFGLIEITSMFLVFMIIFHRLLSIEMITNIYLMKFKTCVSLCLVAGALLIYAAPSNGQTVAPVPVGSKISGRTSNCAFGNNYKTLFITADDYLLKIEL